MRSPNTANYIWGVSGFGAGKTIHIHLILLHALGFSHQHLSLQTLDQHSLHMYELTGWFRMCYE